jgi:hypothetical protein
MVRRDRGGDAGARLLHELHAGARAHVLEHDAQRREALNQVREHRFDEARFAVEDINRGLRHLAVHLQDEVEFAHAREHRLDAFDVPHARVGVRRCARRVELAAPHRAARLGTLDLARIGLAP